MSNQVNQKRTGGPRFLWLFVPLLLAAVLAGCQTGVPTATTEAPPVPDTPLPPATDAPTPAPVVDLEEVYAELWVLVGFGPVDSPVVVERDTVITAQFSPDGTVSGSSGCNSYNGGFEIAADGAVTVPSPFISTMMACERGMEQEQAYLGALSSAQSIEINAEGRLVVTYDSGAGEAEALVYTPGETPLTGTIWTLLGMGDPSDLTEVEAGTAVTAVFDETNISGYAGCNSYTAAYEASDGQMTIGPAASTLRACTAGMDQEAAYLAALAEISTYEILGTQLTLANADGDGVLIFTAASLPLENTLWTLVAANGQPIPEELGLTALFEPGEEAGSGTVAGSAGCNNYFAGYTLDGNEIAITEVGSTFKFCEAGMEVEQSYLAAIQAAESFQILGRTLELTGSEGTLTYVADRTPLQGALWVLTGIGDADEPQGPVQGSNFTAQFSRNPDAPSGVVAGTTGCNEYSAAFAASLTEIRINPPQASDSSGCAQPILLQQTEYFSALSEAETYTIVGNVLRIPYGESNALVFTGTQLDVAGRLPLADLNGTRWFLGYINDQPLAAGTEINASFTVSADSDSGTISGSSGCNPYVADFGLDLGVVATLTSNKTCSQPPGVMEQEQAYINAMNRAYGYWLTGDHLIVNTGLGALTYFTTRPDASLDQAHLLVNKTWFLTSYGDQESVAGASEPTLSFNASGGVSGNTGCNALTGSYTTDVSNISFSNLQVGSANCPDDASNQQQQAMIAALNSSQTFQVVENTMQIVATSGVLNFSTTPPDRVEPVPAPVAVLDGPTEAAVGETVTFDASGSTSTAPIKEYRWNFSDGTVISGVTVQHAYSAAGSYEVILRVFDDLDQVGRVTQFITISEPATPEETPPTAVATGPSNGFVAEPVSFSAADSTAGSSPIVSYAWNFGNGATSPASPDPNVTTLFDASGSYNVVLTVTDQNGLSGTANLTVVIDARLDGPVWVYDPQAPLIGGTAITLQFEAGSFVGFAGCNTYNGTYTATDNGDGTLSVTVSGITTTQIACPPDVMAQEMAYLATLQTATLARLEGNVLILTTPTGDLPYYETGSPILQ